MSADPRYGFAIPLDVRHLNNGKWMVLKEFRYLSALTQKSYTIEAGFVHDFASVPRAPIAYWLTGNTAHLAAVVHDYLYAHPIIESKMVADKIFAEIMDAKFWADGPYDERSGEPPWRREIMWLGVSVFGPRHYWDDDRKPKAGFDISNQSGD